MAISVGVVDLERDEVTFSSAGAEAPLILGVDGCPRSAETRGLPVGAFRDVEYVNSSMPFEPGDTILMATDGVTEARRGKEFLSYDGMVRLAAEHLGRPLSIKAQGQALLEAAREYAGKFQDDVCILLARRL